MPLYEYECADHGSFELLRSLSEYGAQGTCPDCGELGGRIVSAVRTSVMARSEVIARDRNEKSRFEPRMSRTPDGHVHGDHCNHSQGHGKASASGRAKAPAPVNGTPQLKAYTGKRPWVIEHG